MYEYGCKVIRVVDGDTVDVDIDLGFGDLEEKKYGLLAKKMVEFWLPLDSMQTLVTVQDKAGKFGRVLGQFKIDDPLLTLNTWMIQNHYAAEYYGQSKEEIEKIHLSNRKLIDNAEALEC